MLGDRPQLQGRFQALLEVAQRNAVIREQQASSPSAGAAAPLRLGKTLQARGVIDQAEDVFFLTPVELDTRTPMHELVHGAGPPGSGSGARWRH